MKKYLDKLHMKCIFDNECKGETGYFLVVINIPETKITIDLIFNWCSGYLYYYFKKFQCNKIEAEIIRYSNHFINDICAAEFLQSIWIGDKFKGEDIMYARSRKKQILISKLNITTNPK